MSQSDPEEPMELGVQNGTDEVLLTFSLRWSGSGQVQKLKTKLEKLLQTWFNKQGNKSDCSVVDIPKDGIALIKVTPSPALSVLQDLIGETLSKDENHVTILSIKLESPHTGFQRPADESMNDSSSVPDPKADIMQFRQQSDPVGMDSDPVETNLPAEQKTKNNCFVTASVYWYVSNNYKEEIDRIVRENKVKMKPELCVEFEADQKDGDPEKALSEFTELVQDHFSESSGINLPPGSLGPDQWSNALRVIQKKENKLLITLSSEEVRVCGPSQGQSDFNAGLNLIPQKNASLKESQPAPPDRFTKIEMAIIDPLADAGLTMKESLWKQMTSSHASEITKIKEKFGVSLNESFSSPGNINVKASHRGPGGHPSLETHAVRGLVFLYQKIFTSPLGFTQSVGASGFSGSMGDYSNGPEAPNTFSGSAFNKKPTPDHTQEPGKTGDTDEDRCPICLCSFTDKQQLQCKHEFCKTCLQDAQKHNGPICPVCKDVFGLIEGDQPAGNMTWSKHREPLPGFPGCGHICISYSIHSGKQTEKHPNPGKTFTGTSRSAYLPDNKEGNEVLKLLKRAFDQKLIFTVGLSRTTGMEDQVTWNDIHHKTTISGSYGYPDEDYLKRVKEELKAKGIK